MRGGPSAERTTTQDEFEKAVLQLACIQTFRHATLQQVLEKCVIFE